MSPLFETVCVRGATFDVGYNSTPDDFEIVSVSVINDPRKIEDQTDITSWLNDDARREIRAELFAQTELNRMLG